MTTATTCPQCRAEVEPGETTWPGPDGNTVCQSCWEAYSGRLWWEVLAQLPVADEPPSTPDRDGK